MVQNASMLDTRSLDVTDPLWGETKKRIQLHEGCRLVMYLCTAGYKTIGFGHKLEDQSIESDKITMDEAVKMFDVDFGNAKKLWDNLTEAHDILCPTVTFAGIGIEMCFQMGNRVMAFKKFLGHLRTRCYASAAVEMLDSDWYKQTPARALTLAKLLAHQADIFHTTKEMKVAGV